jgi:hypothetical protein
MANETFPAFVLGQPSAVTVNPFDSLPIIQGGVTKNASISQIGGSGSGAVAYSVATGVAAAGSTQGTATPLTKQDNQVTSGTGGVILTLNTPGVPTFVHAYAGAPISVYPISGGQINGIGVNAPYTVVDGSSMAFNCLTSTQWYSTSP